MLIILCLLIGVSIALLSPIYFSTIVSQYVAIAILAGLDSIFGGVAANVNNNFKLQIFLTGFFGNAIIAMVLTYMGNLLNVDMSIAAVVVFGTRLFQNFAIIRRFLLEKYLAKHERKKLM